MMHIARRTSYIARCLSATIPPSSVPLRLQSGQTRTIPPSSIPSVLLDTASLTLSGEQTPLDTTPKSPTSVWITVLVLDPALPLTPTTTG